MRQALKSLDAKSLRGDEYLREMRRFLLDQFQSKTFNLSHEDAKKCADEILKIVRRNYREVETASTTD